MRRIEKIKKEARDKITNKLENLSVKELRKLYKRTSAQLGKFIIRGEYGKDCQIIDKDSPKRKKLLETEKTINRIFENREKLLGLNEY